MNSWILPLIIIALVIPQIHYAKKTSDYKSIRNGTKFFVKSENKSYDHRQIYLTNTDGHDIFIRLYENPNPKGVVQIVHGMAEHSYNYEDFINYLYNQGFTVIAHDHRGHGKSISEKYPNGYMRLSEELVDDVFAVNSYIRNLNPDLPIYMVGHSMGSMIARMYLQKYDQSIDKLVLTGTVEHNNIAPFGVFLGNIICFYFGEYQRAILTPLLPGGDQIDWISYDEDNVMDKRNDKFRVFQFLERGVVTIIDLNNKMARIKDYECNNPKLPILSATGDADIVTGSTEGLENSIASLKNIGYKNITNIVYEHMRHEVLNEKENKKVYQDIVEFLDK